MTLNHNGQPLSNYDIARAYIKSLNVTSWPSVGWSVKGNDDDGLDAAATWLSSAVDHINAVRNMADGSIRSLDDIAKDYRRLVEGERYGADS